MASDSPDEPDQIAHFQTLHLEGEHDDFAGRKEQDGQSRSEKGANVVGEVAGNVAAEHGPYSNDELADSGYLISLCGLYPGGDHVAYDVHFDAN
jgi:hypothetical protein